jgi:phosphoglycerate-specific signal transduction histidine kinase
MNAKVPTLEIKTTLRSGHVNAVVDFLQQTGALDALLIGIFGAAAWFVNKYYGLPYWRHVKDTETIEYLFAVKTEIKKRPVAITTSVIEATLSDAKACIDQGKATIKSIDQKIKYLKERSIGRIVINSLCACLLLIMLVGKVT